VKELLEAVAKALVDNPDKVHVRAIEGEQRTECPSERNGRHHNKYIQTTLALLAAAALLTLLGPLLFAQGSPQVTAVDPSSGKVNDTVTVAGENLGKDTVSAVFLSDDKTDHKATLIEQNAEKIVMKVPQVRPGRYNISIQKGNAIYIQPVRFTVQE
jgi:hypothetical protein